MLLVCFEAPAHGRVRPPCTFVLFYTLGPSRVHEPLKVLRGRADTPVEDQ